MMEMGNKEGELMNLVEHYLMELIMMAMELLMKVSMRIQVKLELLT